MFIVPYLIHNRRGMNQFWIFLERNGNHLIEIGGLEEAVAFAEENGLNGVPRKVDDLILLPVSKEGLADFYSWSEVVPGTIPAKELWRPFIWTAGNEGVNQLLESVQLGPKHTALSILKAILS
jgi:hypothetical protein